MRKGWWTEPPVKQLNSTGRADYTSRLQVSRRALIAAGLFAAPLLGARATTRLSVAIVSRTVFFVPVWLADREGFFASAGLDCDLQIYDNAERINADLKSGKVQIAISTPESVILDAYRGGSLRILAGNAERLPHFIITKPEIKNLAQLRGARIGVLSLNEGTTYLVRKLASAAGLMPSEYSVVAVGGAPSRQKLLAEGKIDAGLQPFPLSYEAEEAGFNNLGPISDYVPDYLFTSINADERWAETNSQIVARFLQAVRRGQTFMQDHPDEAVRVARTELQTSEAFARRALDDTARLKILSPDLSVSNRALKGTFETLAAVGQLGDAKFDFQKIVDLRFLRLSQT